MSDVCLNVFLNSSQSLKIGNFRTALSLNKVILNMDILPYLPYCLDMVGELVCLSYPDSDTIRSLSSWWGQPCS
jgi:hypothetical protein